MSEQAAAALTEAPESLARVTCRKIIETFGRVRPFFGSRFAR